jgi:DNA-binding transcriptional regulator YiaG
VVTSDISEMVTNELRRAAGLLAPEQIRAKRESLGLTQGELAARLRVSEAELGRWESGMQLQSKALDLLLRLYLDSADVRRACVAATATASPEEFVGSTN